uniref:Putative disease resistance RPP8-like protein 2 n=2 Tax=Aegilops tauschii TaxID=37682 RepID=M8B759_AEGTA
MSPPPHHLEKDNEKTKARNMNPPSDEWVGSAGPPRLERPSEVGQTDDGSNSGDRNHSYPGIASTLLSYRNNTRSSTFLLDSVNKLDLFINLKPMTPRRHSDMGELKWQIKCRGMISVHGSAPSKSIIARRLYRGIMYNREEFDGVEFQTHRWVHVVHPFDLMDFSRRLFLDLSSYGFNDDELGKILCNQDIDPQTEDTIQAVLKMGDHDLFEGCRRILDENDCLIVIDGLRSRDDWNMIKSTLLSGPIKGCVLVITNEECVATHCVDDKDRALNSNCRVAEGLALSTRKEEAQDWTNNFELLRHEDIDITNLLKEGPGVASVWGIAGVGKSALVKSVYYRVMLGLYPIYRWAKDPRDRLRRKFTAYSWVDVPHPFNLTEFSRRLLLDFHSDDLQAKETAIVGIIEGQDPIQGCRNIIIITNEGSVAKHCVDNRDDFHVLNVQGLYTWDAFQLFNEKVALNNKQLAPNEMPQSKLIVDMCGGIPKLIVAIGNHSLVSPSFLNNLNDDFIGKLETDPGFHGLRDLLSWMHSYFDACSDSLKPCIFYLSIFSADQNIRRKRLLRRWIAEGYCRDTFNSTAEQNGDRLFSELVGLSIIQYITYLLSMKNQCQVNGFFHEYIISRPMEDNLVFALEGCCGLNSQRGGQNLTLRQNWDMDMNVFENIDFSRLRSLTVFGDWSPMFISKNIQMRFLRVLDLQDTSGVKDDELDQIGELLPRLKFLSLQLQTLDIRHTSIATLPPAIIKLQRLQYIRAGTTTKPFDEGGTVPSLPATDEDMTPAIAENHGEPEATAPAPAEHGDDKATVTTLVEDVDGMAPSQPATAAAAEGVVHTLTRSRSRRHTLLSSRLSKLCQRHGLLDNGGVELPAGFGNLMALHTLGVINVSGAGGKAILKELKKLTQLRKIGLRGVNQENWKEFCSVISGHGHLESLSVHVDKDKEECSFYCFDDISQPPKTLKSLKLHGHVRTMPGWIKQHHYLEKLYLEMTIFSQEDVHVFDDFKESVLHRLLVRPIQDGELHFSLSPHDHSFYNFKVLEIYCTSRLKVTFGPWMAGSVRLLLVHCSSGSSFQISGLCELQSLEEVWLKGSYSNALKKDLQKQLSEHPCKPVLKLVQPRSS